MTAVLLDWVRARIAATPPCDTFERGPLGVCDTCAVSEEVHLLRALLQAWSAQTVAHEALAKTTLVSAEWRQAVSWRDRWLKAGNEDDALQAIVRPLDPQIVAYLVADGEIFRALGEAVIAGMVDPPEPSAAAVSRHESEWP